MTLAKTAPLWERGIRSEQHLVNQKTGNLNMAGSLVDPPEQMPLHISDSDNSRFDIQIAQQQKPLIFSSKGSQVGSIQIGPGL
jgi:hypothetical protein